MFFEELIEQHRVHRFVAHAVGLPLLVTSHQIGVHLLHLLGHEAELRDALGVKLVLVAESDRLEREDRFARFVHGFDRFLEPGRRSDGAEMTIAPYEHCYT